MKFIKTLTAILMILLNLSITAQEKETQSNPPIYIAFLWHMHQPIYWPYESVVQTQANNRYSFSVFDVFTTRTGPYTNWPKDAVQKGIDAGLGNFGTQVSFSGSLVENLNNLEAHGISNFNNWKSHWEYMKNQNTILGNPRMDMVGFGYHHPLMGLIDYNDIRRQIQDHKTIFAENFTGNYSKGIFPPENAFTLDMIPALVDEGLEWVLIDNIHFERACENYPFSMGGNLYEPNKSDVLNPNPGDWVQLNGVWAGTQVSAQWAHQPHYVEHVDPNTGVVSRIVAVPSDRYLGVEDGRGGFGALQYEDVMSQLEFANTDPDHPILIVLAHDGDNFGGGSESYYNSNFQNFVSWLQANPSRFVCTTIQDYLEMFPPETNDVIHTEAGSWSGADNGDPEFKKWLADPNDQGYSPDRNSWGIVTAAKNFLETADDVNPNHPDTETAFHYFLNSQASDYWYWDFSENGVWDSHPARACNLAVPFAQNVIQGQSDNTPPSIFEPQREPYNPGETEWGISQSSDFTVWSYVFDVSGMQSVTLKYRIDNDGVNSSSTTHNETYAGGSDVGSWVSVSMNGVDIPSQTNPAPLFKAKEYSAEIAGHQDVLIDYYIEAVDVDGNTSKSNIKHVWVGNGTGGGGSNETWYVRGSFNEWNATEVMNDEGIDGDAAAEDGIFSAAISITTPGRYEWKIATDDWSINYPVENSWLVTTESNQNVLFTFNTNSMGDGWLPSQYIINADDQLPPTNTIVAAGYHNSWNNAGSETMYDNGTNGDIAAGDGIYCYHAVISSPGNYGWKPVISGSWDAWGSNNRSINSANIDYSTSAPNTDVYFYLDLNTGRTYTAIDDPLPVELVFFSAKLLDNKVELKWKTLTEKNNMGFDIERSCNESEFERIAFVEGNGTTVEENDYLFIDANLEKGDYEYRLKQIDYDGFYEYSNTISISVDELVPSEFELYQNYPNPFNPVTKIQYSIPSVITSEAKQSLNTTLKVYDIIGREVAVLVNEQKEPGVYEVTFDASKLSSGLYFYSLSAAGKTITKKMMLLR
ncbi:MAG: T9SS type A sorting domain-containing protein [Melioribacteraceae bacterium]|nr:T9SS type A sorting domain-containing protein [Melioribacteraceae bacterium]